MERDWWPYERGFQWNKQLGGRSATICDQFLNLAQKGSYTKPEKKKKPDMQPCAIACYLISIQRPEKPYY